ncbi:MAG: cytochrome c-type biogenesis protein CcmH [Myxococcota bacterium]|nr:cytochrome c-type biogenesis protein CcmH [Myxococcota bacterium]
MSRVRSVIALSVLLALPLVAAAPAVRADTHHEQHPQEGISFDHVPGAAALEGKIIAPCCWNQTIDIHGSEISTQLRVEIRKRLTAGETPEAIEASLVQRYGQKVIAVPQGSRLGATGVLLAIAMGAAGVFAFSLLRRWRDRVAPPPPKREGEEPASATPALDSRLDAELAALDRE